MHHRPLALLLSALFVALVFAVQSPQASSMPSALDQPELPNTIIVGWDGVQRDHFWECYSRELPECPNGLPNIKRLADGRIFDQTVTDGATSTKPGWAQILSGYNAEVMGIYRNTEYRPLPEGYTVMEKLEAAYGDEAIETVFISGKGDHVGATCQGELTYAGRPEEYGQPWCLTKRQIDLFVEAGEKNMPSEDTGFPALAAIREHFVQRPDQALVALFHFAEPDPTGHSSGENSVEYSEKLIEVDLWLGRIMFMLRGFGAEENTLVYVITDHGFDEGGTSHANAPFGMLATNDPLVNRGGDRKDLAPTLLERYGIGLDAQGEIPPVDGHSLYGPPPYECVPEGMAYVDFPGAPTCCAGLTTVGLGKSIPSPQAYEACVEPTGGAADGSGYCTMCGDGQCAQNEGLCNCYADCAGVIPPQGRATVQAPEAVDCPAGTSKNTILQEGFVSWPPSGWSVVDNGGDCAMERNTTWDRPNNTGASGSCADADSDRCGEGTTMDVELRTPAFELPASSQAYLQFKSAYLNFLGEDEAKVEVSADGGDTWSGLLAWNEDHLGPVTVDLDLTHYAGSPDTVIRWRYTAPGWHWYWEVDDVEVAVCELAPPSVDLDPESQESAGCVGDEVQYALSLWNRTGAPGLFALTYDSDWLVDGPAAVYAELDETIDFSITVAIEAGGEDTASVFAQGNGHTAYAEVRSVETAHWASVPSAPTTRGDLAVVATGSGLYAIGGTEYGVPPGNGENEYYDYTSGSWSARSPLPVPLTLIDAAEIDGVIYVPGGHDGNGFSGATFAYDTGNDTWTSIAPAPREVVGYGVAACEGRLYRVGGGEAGFLQGGERDGEVYDPAAGAWTSLPSMTQGHLWPAVGCIGGKLYVAGGIGVNRRETAVAEVYDPATGQWSDAAMADVPRQAMGSAGVVVQDRLYVFGGSSGGKSLSTARVYDPQTDTWSNGPELPEARFRGDGVALQELAFVLGGWEPIWTPHETADALRQCGQCLHVERIAMKSRDVGPDYRTSSAVFIADAGGLSVEGASVSVTWTLPDGSNVHQAAETNANGRVVYHVTSALEGDYKVCVSGVVKDGYGYDPSQNLETCDSLAVP